MNRTIKSAALDLARHGLHGTAGETLPCNMASSDVAWISANQPAFRVAVSTYGIILRCRGRSK